ncbi:MULTISPECIES: helix-turn-helix domain-containing protein [unclassified Pantoea]|uniref:helix-turn-helix domain-containing protein n=1 Tax=unclassified Pantoea TaxID=2630326 RepID=UPI002579DE78|nr:MULTISPECIES: helix-turn-helix domain-containing protein [unclassified Pantoea]MDU5473801.1 helix-turn-helix domain-containing protein [Pantoea sp.]
MEKETTGDRIRFRRKALNLTQKAVAEKISVSHVAISQWEKEETLPRGENLLRLAEVLGCAPAWLVDGDGPVFTVQTQAQTGLPFLEREQIGDWLAEATQVEILRRIPTDRSYSATSFALTLWDNALAPQCLRGDLLLIDPELPPQPGDLVLALTGENEYVLRKYRARSHNSFELAPLNEDYPLLRSSEQALSVLGTLVEWRRYRDAAH